MKQLEGFYSEDVLQELLCNGEIGHLSFVCHLSEEQKEEFFNYCDKNGLEKDEKAAQKFLKDKLEEEVQNHSIMD